MAKVQANFRLDEELLGALKSRADTEGKSTTEITSQALKQYLGLVDIQSNIQIAIQPNNELYDRIDERISIAIQQAIQPIYDRIDTVEALAKKLHSLSLESQQTQVNPVVDDNNWIPLATAWEYAKSKGYSKSKDAFRMRGTDSKDPVSEYRQYGLEFDGKRDKSFKWRVIKG